MKVYRFCTLYSFFAGYESSLLTLLSGTFGHWTYFFWFKTLNLILRLQFMELQLFYCLWIRTERSIKLKVNVHYNVINHLSLSGISTAQWEYTTKVFNAELSSRFVQEWFELNQTNFLFLMSITWCFDTPWDWFIDFNAVYFSTSNIVFFESISGYEFGYTGCEHKLHSIEVLFWKKFSSNQFQKIILEWKGFSILRNLKLNHHGDYPIWELDRKRS